MYDPWYKTKLLHAVSGRTLTYHVPHDVFSTQRVDEGTILLLENLPHGTPHAILDMGCGYGALGLPVAIQFPEAKIEMVDRDLLAVAWAKRNAVANKCENTDIHGSLGYRDIDASKRYDWILCNIPARIGKPFMENFLLSGRSRLRPGGELHIVVIRDLMPLIMEIQRERNLPVIEAAVGPRHTVYSLAADERDGLTPEPDDLYFRDRVSIAGFDFDRPFDLGGDDPRRLKNGLPVLLDALINLAPERVLCFRSGYGILPVLSRKRWQDAQVTAVDRDLLASAFTRRNAVRLGADNGLTIRESAFFPDAVKDEKFDLAIGEIVPSAGNPVAIAELDALGSSLSKNGEAYVLMLEKTEKELRPLTTKLKRPPVRIIARDGYVVTRL